MGRIILVWIWSDYKKDAEHLLGYTEARTGYPTAPQIVDKAAR